MSNDEHVIIIQSGPPLHTHTPIQSKCMQEVLSIWTDVLTVLLDGMSMLIVTVYTVILAVHAGMVCGPFVHDVGRH